MKGILRPYIPLLFAVSILVLTFDVGFISFRVLGLSRNAAIYCGLFTFTLVVTRWMNGWLKPQQLSDNSGETVMVKKSLLPPPVETQKREVSVNLHFSSDVYERLKTLADFSGTSVAGLLFYVTVNTTLPLMEREMNKAKVITLPKSTSIVEPPPAPLPKLGQE